MMKHAYVALCLFQWPNKNDLVFNHKVWSLTVVIRMTTLLLNEWNNPLISTIMQAALDTRQHNSCRHFVDVSFHFIPRSTNMLAHALARETTSQSGPSTWFSTYPACIQHLTIRH